MFFDKRELNLRYYSVILYDYFIQLLHLYRLLYVFCSESIMAESFVVTKLNSVHKLSIWFFYDQVGLLNWSILDHLEIVGILNNNKCFQFVRYWNLFYESSLVHRCLSNFSIKYLLEYNLSKRITMVAIFNLLSLLCRFKII